MSLVAPTASRQNVYRPLTDERRSNPHAISLADGLIIPSGDKLYPA
jgi:hypothetical protein